MNYTGRPSISGCRPVLSLYPTHCFCQYLLRIFITFTNSPLFSRAFYTNSRKELGKNLSGQRLSLWERSSTSPSRLTPCHCPGCGSQRLLRCRSHPAGRGPNSSSLFPPLAAVVAVAPEGEPLAGRITFHWTPEARQDAKGRALLQRAGSSLYNLSVSLRSTAPLVGEPLAKPFTLRGLPKPPLLGEVAARQR